MWGAITNTGYNGMPASLGLVLIHCLGQRSIADKLRTLIDLKQNICNFFSERYLFLLENCKKLLCYFS